MSHNQNKFNRNDALAISLGAHRGGGFTKERLYLSGLRKIYKRYLAEASMEPLLSGKVSLDYESAIGQLRTKGLVQNNLFVNLAYTQNSNTNKTLDFILNNLK